MTVDVQVTLGHTVGVDLLGWLSSDNHVLFLYTLRVDIDHVDANFHAPFAHLLCQLLRRRAIPRHRGLIIIIIELLLPMHRLSKARILLFLRAYLANSQ